VQGKREEEEVGPDKIRDFKEKEGLLLGRKKCNFWLLEGACKNR